MEQRGETYNKADVAASFQCAAIDVLVEKTVAAAKEKGVDTVTAGGGVAANTYLREHLAEKCKKNGLKLVLPEKRYCTDNAAMIAAEGVTQFHMGNFADLSLTAKASIPLAATLKQNK
jgi:N6-L-threonylcarbamoyladenine synthase